jgi:hypothetical protein
MVAWKNAPAQPNYGKASKREAAFAVLRLKGKRFCAGMAVMLHVGECRGTEEAQDRRLLAIGG